MDHFSLFTLLTGSLGVFILIAYLLINTILTGWLANQKGYSVEIWVALAFFFGPLALLTLGFAPNLYTEETLSNIEESLEAQNQILTSNSVNVKQDNPIITNTDISSQKTSKDISSDASNYDDLQLNDSSLLNKTQYDNLSYDDKDLYKKKINEKIKLEINEAIKLTYYQNLSYLGYSYYDRYLSK